MDIQFMKDYYDLRYEETDGENHFVEETAYQEKQSEQSKMEDQLMEMVGGSESNVWKLYESIMCVYFDMEEIINYEHEIDANGEVIADYPDGDDHWIDSLRYATSPISMRRGYSA